MNTVYLVTRGGIHILLEPSRFFSTLEDANKYKDILDRYNGASSPEVIIVDFPVYHFDNKDMSYGNHSHSSDGNRDVYGGFGD